MDDIAESIDRKGSQWLKFHRISIFDPKDNEIGTVLSGQDIYLRFYYRSKLSVPHALVQISLTIKNSMGYLLANLNSYDSGHSNMDIADEGFFECYLPKFNLRSDTYDCGIFIRINGEIVDWISGAFRMTVIDGDYYGTGQMIERGQGIVLMNYSWSSR